MALGDLENLEIDPVKYSIIDQGHIIVGSGDDRHTSDKFGQIG